MINHIYARQYCKNYEQIENYQEAVSSPEVWDCHHKNEIDMNLSKKELIDIDLYYNRPPEELIFLKHTEHAYLHNKGKTTSLETRHKMSIARKGYRLSEESKQKISIARKGKVFHTEESKQKISEAFKGDKHPRWKFICPIKLTYMYCKLKMSACRIAKEFGVDKNVIRRRLRELNIPIRKR